MEESTVVAFRIPRDLCNLLEERAERERRTRSNMMRVILEDWLMDRAANTHRTLVDPPGVYVTAGERE